MFKLKKKKSEEKQRDPMLIPFMNLVCLLIPFLLLTATFISYAVINVSAPPFVPSPVEKSESPKMNLTLFATDQGFTISAWGQTLKSDEVNADVSSVAGPTIPAKNLGGKVEYDWDALTQRMREIKDANEEETSVKIGAEKDIAYETIVKVMDAVREDDKGKLFPDVIMVGGVL